MLLFSKDPAAVEAMLRTAQCERIPLDLASEPRAARQLVSGKRYQAVVVDFDLPEAPELLAGVNGCPHKPIALAVLPPGVASGDAFRAGGTLAIHKPLTRHSLRSSLRVACDFGRQSRRQTARADAGVPALVAVHGAGIFSSSIVNLSEQGACLKMGGAIVPGTSMTLRFALPGAAPFDLGAMAVWSDGRRVGVRNRNLRFHHESTIRNWIRQATLAL